VLSVVVLVAACAMAAGVDDYSRLKSNCCMREEQWPGIDKGASRIIAAVCGRKPESVSALADSDTLSSPQQPSTVANLTSRITRLRPVYD